MPAKRGAAWARTTSVAAMRRLSSTDPQPPIPRWGPSPPSTAQPPRAPSDHGGPLSYPTTPARQTPGSSPRGCGEGECPVVVPVLLLLGGGSLKAITMEGGGIYEQG